MAYVPKPKKLTCDEQIERDAVEFAQLIYDIYRDKKQQEKNKPSPVK